MRIKKDHIILSARGLATEDASNPEYDRALVELAATLVGEVMLLSDDREAAEMLVLGRTIAEPSPLEDIARNWAFEHGYMVYEGIADDIRGSHPRMITAEDMRTILDLLESATITFGETA